MKRSAVPLSRLRPGPNHARASRFFGDIEALATQLEANKRLEPLWVLPRGSDFEIIAGERRYRALCILKQRKALWFDANKVPVEICDVDETEAFMLNITENAGRLELALYDMIMVCRVAITEKHLRPEDVAKRLGVGANYVYRCARVAALVHPEILQAVRNGAPIPFNTLRRWSAMPHDAQLSEYNGAKEKPTVMRFGMRQAAEIRIALSELGDSQCERYAAEWLAWVLRERDHKPRKEHHHG